MFNDVTLNMFVWYRDLEKDLWLEENQDKHAWIIYDSDENDFSEDEEFKSSLDDSCIRSWRKSAISDVVWFTLTHDRNE